MKSLWILVMIFSVSVFGFTGCSSFVNLNERQIRVEDVISMTKAGVSPDVIKSQIEATNSRFKLSSDQIIQLKKEGVDENVIKAMIETESLPEPYDREYGMSPYDYWYNYYNSWYPSYSYPYFNPYIVYRDPSKIGRFYRYYPVYPPSRYYQYHNWLRPEEEGTRDSKQKN
jgi:hypothetical protein